MPGGDQARAGGTLAGDLDIVDAHVHLINLEGLDYPWIQHRSAVLEALLDNYYDAAHDYGVGRYRSDTAGARPARWVACEFGAADPVAEAEWIQRCSQSQGAPHAFIAAVDLTSPSLGEVLARYCDLPVVHAVRQPLYWAQDRLRRLGARPDYLTDPAWWRGFERVAEEGLTWDLLLYDEQLPAAHTLIRSFPQARISPVLNGSSQISRPCAPKVPPAARADAEMSSAS